LNEHQSPQYKKFVNITGQYFDRPPRNSNIPDYILCIISRNLPFDQREGLMSQPRVTIPILHHNLFRTCSSCVWIFMLSACSANKRIL